MRSRPFGYIASMPTPSASDRTHFLDVIEGRNPGSYIASITLLNLDRTKDAAFVSKVCYLPVEEVEKIAQLYTQGGVEAIANYQVPDNA